MTPVYDVKKYYDVLLTYKNRKTGEISCGEVTRFESMSEVQDYIDNKIQENIHDIENSGYLYNLIEVKIDHIDKVQDYTNIIEWQDLRPGDYAIHTHSTNNISTNIEVGFDFYVAKLDRDQNVYVDKYYICWHAYQGVFIISRYPDTNIIDKSKLITEFTIYDERLLPTINELETDIGKKWIYTKIAKYASLYAIENPNNVPISSIEV